MGNRIDRFEHAARYRRRVTEVWAIQLLPSTGNRVAKHIADLADGVESRDENGRPLVSIRTANGTMVMRSGDYLVVDEDGVHPIPGELFDSLYVVDAGDPGPLSPLDQIRQSANEQTLRSSGRRRDYHRRRSKS